MSERHAERGFTLVEVLVTVLILGLLAAVVFPVVVPQINKADPTKASNDLANVRTGIELFQLDVRPRTPGDIEDVANLITTNDSDVDDTGFTTGDTTKWDGPYVDRPQPEIGVAVDDTAFETGFEGQALSDLFRFNSATTTANHASTNTGEASTADADFVAVRVLNVDSTEFERLNDQIDGEGETDGSGDGNSHEEGRLRFDTGTEDVNGDGSNDAVVYYLAVPFKD